MRATRRRILGFGGLLVTSGLAGCGGDEPPPGLYASKAQLVHRAGDDRFDYPEDIGVRVSVENTASDRHDGVLETTLEHVDESAGETPTVLESWSKTQDVSVSRGSTRAIFVVFEDVFEEGDDEDAFRARANIDVHD